MGRRTNMLFQSLIKYQKFHPLSVCKMWLQNEINLGLFSSLIWPLAIPNNYVYKASKWKTNHSRTRNFKTKAQNISQFKDILQICKRVRNETRDG